MKASTISITVGAAATGGFRRTALAGACSFAGARDKGQWLSGKPFVRDRSMRVIMMEKSRVVAGVGWVALLSMSSVLLACSGADGACEEREQSLARAEQSSSDCDESQAKSSQAAPSKTPPNAEHDNRWPSAIRVGPTAPR
jgi:hypothetical protein